MTLRWAIGLLLGEAVAVTAITLFLVYEAATATSLIWQDALLVVVFAAIMAALLGLFGWNLLRRRGWARGPAVVLELMLLPIGWFMIGGNLAWLGIPVFVLGLLGVGLLVTPATGGALGVK
jgi:hypothetical protein